MDGSSAPVPAAFPAPDGRPPSPSRILRRDLAALADVESKQNAFLQGHSRELLEACEHRGRLDGQMTLAFGTIGQLEYDLQAEVAVLRAQLAKCDVRLRSVLGSRVWRSYQWLQRTRSRLRKLFAAVFDPMSRPRAAGQTLRGCGGSPQPGMTQENPANLPLTHFGRLGI